MKDVIIALDQGTTSSRAIAFDRGGSVLGIEQCAFPQHFPNNGWVEHDAEDLWQTSRDVLKRLLVAFGDRVAALAIANQRETTLLWDRNDGQPVHRAIVWQDRRTAAYCDALRRDGCEDDFRQRTGLCLDPYFSASKIAWLLDQNPDWRRRAEEGKLAFGTVDSFLIYRLTGGRCHLSDVTNASRTGLFNIHTMDWDDNLLALFQVPRAILPQICDSVASFGVCDANIVGAAVPIIAVAGDQQAAAIGQGCLQPGMVKSTYGTGCFVLAHSGERPIASRHRLLATVASRYQDVTAYALEGSIFVAGAAVQWLRDGLGLITTADETEAIAASVASTGGVYMVPAFTGLGAPYWDADARGALIGMTRDTDRAVIVRATLESAAYQTADLIAAMRADHIDITTLRVDGGMARNDWFCGFLADILDLQVARPALVETTAAGVALLAGLGLGWHQSLSGLAAMWRSERVFEPSMKDPCRRELLAGWAAAIARVRH